MLDSLAHTEIKKMVILDAIKGSAYEFGSVFVKTKADIFV